MDPLVPSVIKLTGFQKQGDCCLCWEWPYHVDRTTSRRSVKFIGVGPGSYSVVDHVGSPEVVCCFPPTPGRGYFRLPFHTTTAASELVVFFPPLTPDSNPKYTFIEQLGSSRQSEQTNSSELRADKTLHR